MVQLPHKQQLAPAHQLILGKVSIKLGQILQLLAVLFKTDLKKILLFDSFWKGISRSVTT